MGKPLLIWAPTHWPTVDITGTNLTGTLADLREPDEGTYCTATAAGNITITMDLLTARAVTHLAIAGELLAGLTVAVDCSTTGAAWSSVTLAATTMANNLANIIKFSASQSYRYFRLTITSAPTNCRIYHLLATTALDWPYMMPEFDAIGYKMDATVLTSPQGHLIGLQRNGCTRELNINFGQLTGVEMVSILALYDEVIRTPQGWFFQPDTADTLAYFGYADLGKQYSAPQGLSGLYTHTPISFIARVP